MALLVFTQDPAIYAQADPTWISSEHDVKQPGAEMRANARSNMFLGAVLRGIGFSAPVKIRNMSVAGALIEGAAVPKNRTKVQLVRGRLVVPAHVAWASEGQCGLRFLSLVRVRDWLAPPPNDAQQRIDDAVELLKRGAVPLPERVLSTAIQCVGVPHFACLCEDLERATRLIDELGDELSLDEQALAGHGDKLQNLDIAVQIIAVVIDAIKGESDPAVIAARLDNLRASCAIALDVTRAIAPSSDLA